ncbi:hypothetical protein QNH10_01285 [Sporosarcina thermotolerans]|uniref:hypothetical protein n=1 Tax=Sporosarcina thermotolerans TaxID=633404 RepID=UPI0024BCF5FB|nr:hypothetical protein [Sporosarcina thermotolerans]WHT48504.1 hypothetical protein QNH10_01285 [Sporosarcina thermotolerans]
MASIEKNVEKVNGQVQELAKLINEAIVALSNEINELTEKWSEQQIEKEETNNQQIEPARTEKTEHTNSKSKQPDTYTTGQQNTLPSFRQLKQLAQQPTFQTTDSTNFNTPRFYTPAIPIEATGLRELEPIIYEEKKSPSKGETVDTSVRPLSGQTSGAQQERNEPQSIQPVNQLHGSDENQTSPFWKMFKKK